MRYIKVIDDGNGGSCFQDAEVAQAETPYTENTPPVLVSAAIPGCVTCVVTLPPDVRETGWHPPPRRQLVVILDGEFELAAVAVSRSLSSSRDPGSVMYVCLRTT